MDPHRAFLLFGLLVAIVLLMISSEVAARDLAGFPTKTENVYEKGTETNRVNNDAKFYGSGGGSGYGEGSGYGGYPGYPGSYPGYPGSYPGYPGGYPVYRGGPGYGGYPYGYGGYGGFVPYHGR
ncbi:Glycine rich protein [Melia azedarach]|uniref:Glycine rich protein n=1 Tax=Melia azedarach TaxID=155640 RepID=A0ACC1Z324_MELAZ|nr:Glycine rich protein [Melia azedarach]